MFPNQFNQGAYPQLGGYNPTQTTYPQIQPPSLSAVANPQPVTPSVTKPLIGRVVTTADEILMNDVPQDNTIALFPMQDYSCILAKQWSKDGTRIDTIRYVPDMSNQQPEESEITLNQIMNEISNIKDMLKNPPRNNYHKKNYNKDRNHKPEVATEAEVN